MRMTSGVEEIETETVITEDGVDNIVKLESDANEHEYHTEEERTTIEENGEIEIDIKNHNGIEYKYEDCECETITEEQVPQEQVIIESTDEQQQYHLQNGDGGNLYVISTVTTGEDGTQQEGQYIATSAELYEAANAVGGQIVNISDLTSSDLIQGQHIIIDGTPVLLDGSGIIDESGSFLMDHQEVIVQDQGMEMEVVEDHETKLLGGMDGHHSNDNLLQFHSVDLSPATVSESGFGNVQQAYYTTQVQHQNPFLNTNPQPAKKPKHSTPKTNSYKYKADKRTSFSSPATIDDTIMCVIKKSAQLRKELEENTRKEKELEIAKRAMGMVTPPRPVIAVSFTPPPSVPKTTAPTIVLPPPPPLRPLTAPPIIHLAPLAPPTTPSVVKQENYESSENDMEEKSPEPPAPTQQPQSHTVIMIKDKRKRFRGERNPMELPFSYAGQSFNVQAQKLILNVMHFFKCHKQGEFLDTIKTPQEKAARVLNVSSSVIGKIRKNFKLGRLEQPGKKRQMTKRVLDKVDTFDEDIIRKIIRDMLARKQTPTIPMILAEAREKISFVGSRTSFRRILHRMGYKYGMLKSKIEKKMVLGEGVGVVASSETPASTPQTQNTPAVVVSRPPPPAIPIGTTRFVNSATVSPSLSTINNTIPRLVATSGGIQVSRQPPQIQIIKREKDASTSVPLIFSNSGSLVIPTTNVASTATSGNIPPQPRQIIIHQGGTATSGQQYFTIHPNQFTNSSGQPQIIRIIHAGAPVRTVPPST